MNKLLMAAVACLITLASSSCRAEGTREKTTENTVEQQAEEHHLSLLIAGDLMQHGPQINAARQKDGSYNYDECFARIHDEVERADVAIGNFEVTLGGKPYAGYPQFRAKCAPFLNFVSERLRRSSYPYRIKSVPANSCSSCQ